MPSPRISSRLAKNQQQKLLRQTMLYVVAAVLLVIAFIFFILPRTINLFFTLTSGSSDALSNKSGLPPQVPVFAAPPQATSSAIITMSGYAEGNNEVVMIVNGNQQHRTQVKEDGTFEIKVNLQEGENVVTAFAIDEDKEESEISRSYTIILDNKAPQLDLESPEDGQSIELARNQTTTVSGKTESDAQLQLNGRLVYVNADGSFSTSYQLQEGDNTLDFTAIDRAGNQSTKSIKVTFRL